jgi:hypothetical protein
MPNRQKGSDFERKISKDLSIWWSDGERDDIFWRSSMSGGRASVRAKQGKRTDGQYGDIVAIDPSGALLVRHIPLELKCGYLKWCLLDLIDSPTSAAHPFVLFCQQSMKMAVLSGTPWWALLTHRDRKETCVSVPDALWSWLLFTWPSLDNVPRIHLSTGAYNVHTFRLDALLKTVPANELRNELSSL